MGPLDWNAEQLPRQNIRGRGSSPNERGPAGRKRAIDALGAASAKLQNRFTLGRQRDTRRFGGDQRLEVDDVEWVVVDEADVLFSEFSSSFPRCPRG